MSGGWLESSGSLETLFSALLTLAKSGIYG
jgi:hypothetical protein